MSSLASRWLPAFALVGASFLPARGVSAGDGAGPTDRDRAVAAALESANLRMRAKVEEAAILDRQGNHEAAVAALRAVEGIHREVMAFVERWLSTPLVRVAAPGPVRPPLRIAGSFGVRPAVALDAADVAPIRAAANHLLTVQRPDGWFRNGVADLVQSDVAVEAGNDADVPTTALAILALVDATAVERDGAVRARAQFGVKRGVGALLASQRDSGAFGNGTDLEAHALGAWAVAAGVSLLGLGNSDGDAPVALERALAFSLARRDERGLWSAGTGSPSDDWIVSAWMSASMYELATLPDRPDGAVDLDDVLLRTQKGAQAVDVGASEGLTSAARFAHALLAGDLDDPAPGMSGDASADPLPRTVDDEMALLLGTAYRYGRGMGYIAWREASLAPELARQRREGSLAGSWEPVGARAKAHGRTYATACELLAALIPLVPYREPEGD